MSRYRSGLLAPIVTALTAVGLSATDVPEIVRYRAPPNCHVEGVVISPSGRVLAGIAEKRIGHRIVDGVAVWDLESGKTVRALQRGSPFESLRALAVSQDDKKLATGDDAGSAVVWNLETGAVERRFKVSKDFALDHVVFSPKDDLLATGTHRAVELWDLRSGKLKRRLRGLYSVDAIAFSPDGRYVAGGCGLCLLGTLKQIQAIHVGLLKDIRNGGASREIGQLCVWDVRTGETTWSRDGGRSLFIASIAFSPDGALLGTGGEEVRLWDARTGAVKQIFEPVDERRGDMVTRPVAFSSDGQVLASGGWRQGDNGSVGDLQIWNVSTGLRLQPLTHPRPHTVVKSIGFSREDRLLAARIDGRDAVAEIWHTRRDAP